MNKKGKKHSRQDWLLTLFALPFIIWTILFKYVPLAGWALAFTNYKPGRSLDKLTFVGFKYFKLIGYYWEEIRNALKNTVMAKPLEGIKVLELADYVSAPLCARLPADLGADVFVTNNRPAALKWLGLHYEQLMPEFPSSSTG